MLIKEIIFYSHPNHHENKLLGKNSSIDDYINNANNHV